MKKYFTILFFVLLYFTNLSVAQTLDWARHFAGTNLSLVRSFAIDNNGNVYCIGEFSYFCDFDPGAGTFSLLSNGGTDIYITKLDNAGNLVWAKNIGGPGGDIGYDLVLDSNANIYIAGTFLNTVDFDPGAGVSNLTSAGNTDIFCCKFDSAANFLWAKQMGGPGTDSERDLIIDSAFNLYLSGNFIDSIDVNPGSAVQTMVSSGDQDFFISKLNSSGDLIWAKQFGGPFSDGSVALACGANGNFFSTGFFYDTTDFDPGPATHALSSIGLGDIYILNLDTAGNFIWVRQLSGPNSENGASITCDLNGNVLITGIFRDSTDLDPGPATHYLFSDGDYDVFVLKLDNAGNFQWVNKIGNSLTDGASKIVSDASGHCYVTGHINWNFFMQKFDNSGNSNSFMQVYSMGSSGLALDDSGSIYIGGSFWATVDFDPGPGIYNLTPASSENAFIWKLSDITTGISETGFSQSDFLISPNPAAGQINIICSEKMDELVVSTATGQIISRFHPNEKTFSISLEQEGLYFIHLSSGNRVSTRKVVVVK